MSMNICGAPCCWGVDDPKNPYLPPWQRVLFEAGQAGYRAIELGPYGYLPIDAALVSAELTKNGLAIVAGTIFHDLLDPDNQSSVLRAVDDICQLDYRPRRCPSCPATKAEVPHAVSDCDGLGGMTNGIMPPAIRTPRRAFPRRSGSVSWAMCARSASVQTPTVCARSCTRTRAVTSNLPMRLKRWCTISPMKPPGFVWIPATCITRTWIRFPTSKNTPVGSDYVHFKDVNQNVYQEVLGEHIRFFEGCGKGSMCPIGAGALDYPGIKQALEEIGYSGYITIEQERDPRNSNTSLRDVKASVEYLKSVGYMI